MWSHVRPSNLRRSGWTQWLRRRSQVNSELSDPAKCPNGQSGLDHTREEIGTSETESSEPPATPSPGPHPRRNHGSIGGSPTYTTDNNEIMIVRSRPGP